jgi:monolysocardiolipin acyltransferase
VTATRAAAAMGARAWPLVYTGEGEPPTVSPWGGCGRAATLVAVTGFGKLVLNVLNTTTCVVRHRACGAAGRRPRARGCPRLSAPPRQGCERFQSTVMERPAGRPLITVSNHASTMDDPCLFNAMLPARFFATEPEHERVRWTLCANDICHQSKLMSDFFRAGKTLPVVRGGGHEQPILALMVQRLREHGDWLHVFPEGRVRQDGQMNPMKLGLAHVLCGAADAAPIVLPFHHRGMEGVLPVKTWRPRLGNHVQIVVGEPIDMADLLLRCRKVRLRVRACACANMHALRRACPRRDGASALPLCAPALQKGEDQHKLAKEILQRVAVSLENLRLAQEVLDR